MKIIRSLLIVTMISGVVSCNQEKPDAISIVPKPVNLEPGAGHVTLKPGFSICLSEGQRLSAAAGYLADRLLKATGIELPVAMDARNRCISLRLDSLLAGKLGSEGYELVASGGRIEISAAAEPGIFYGIQTLFQLLPPEIYSDQPVESIQWRLPAVRITDYPRFAWRGYMLDVSRHFMPSSFLFEMLDYLAYHKLNRFHLHLTDDQGWRVEIRKYPRLTEVGGWRVNREDRHWNSREPQKPGEIADYGGFYTQEEIRKLVAYAAERHITIVPEIEMPAHATAALASYPEHSCTGEPLTVLPGGIWPCSNIFCAGKEETFTFLEDVLAEVMELFPSPYIHIGGDEADKTEWIKCPLCQQRIRAEGLKDEHELQSYFIQRMEKYLNSKGRMLIGWDEILEGGLADNAAVMSWRGTQGGIAAAKAGHFVVMSPTSHCYFDYYQGSPDLEPLAIGGYLPLEKVYSFEPVPQELTEEEGQMVMGAQANLWTEYVPDPSHAEYMTFPRLSALSEVCWTPKEMKDYGDFTSRLPEQVRRFEILDIHYARSFSSVEITTRFNQDDQEFGIELLSDFPGTEVRFTLDGSDPGPESELYTTPFTLDRTTTVKAVALLEGQPYSRISVREVLIHLASGRPVTYLTDYSPKYSAGGESALVDGIRGSINLSDGTWQGFDGNDLQAEIDLGSLRTVGRISVGVLQTIGSWVFFPQWVEFSYAAEDKSFKELGKVANQIGLDASARQIQDLSLPFEPVEARFIRVNIRNTGTCPEWHAGAGNPAWLFVDEIIVE